MTLKPQAPIKNVYDEGIAEAKTSLDITGVIAALTAYSVTASGANYTKSGDDGNLGPNAASFNDSVGIRVELNGVNQEKSTEAVWVSSTTFTLSVPTNFPDVIKIYT